MTYLVTPSCLVDVDSNGSKVFVKVPMPYHADPSIKSFGIVVEINLSKNKIIRRYHRPISKATLQKALGVVSLEYLCLHDSITTAVKNGTLAEKLTNKKALAKGDIHLNINDL